MKRERALQAFVQSERGLKLQLIAVLKAIVKDHREKAIACYKLRDIHLLKVTFGGIRLGVAKGIQ